MNEIILIRHGQSMANQLRLFGGDYPLSETGKQQAIDAKSVYSAWNADGLYCSCLQRTKQTAELLFDTVIPREHQLPEFNEISFGRIENMPDTRTGVEGFVNSYQGDFVAFLHECSGDNPYRRADIAISKLLELSQRMAAAPGEYPNGRLLIVTSSSLMGSIMLTLVRGHRWRKLTAIPHPKNLDYVRFLFDDAGSRILGYEFCGVYQELSDKSCPGTVSADTEAIR